MNNCPWVLYLLLLILSRKLSVSMKISGALLIGFTFPPELAFFLQPALVVLELPGLGQQSFDSASEPALIFGRRLSMEFGCFEHRSLLPVLVLSESFKKALSLSDEICIVGGAGLGRRNGRFGIGVLDI